MKTLNPAIKHHAIIGTLLSVWVFLFAYFIRPFEHGIMDEQKWISVSVGFTLIVFLSYLATSVYQKMIYVKGGKWNYVLEISTYILFYLIFSISSYLYYRSAWIQGFYDPPEYFSKIIVKVVLILTPLLFFARRYASNLQPEKGDEITIRGENKLDILHLKKSELVCVSNAHNYVEVYFLENQQLKKKLIRSSLKKIHQDVDFLIQIHRSHLINPAHIRTWKNATHISLTQIELPVAKNYRQRLLDLNIRT